MLSGDGRADQRSPPVGADGRACAWYNAPGASDHGRRATGGLRLRRPQPRHVGVGSCGHRPSIS